MPRSYNWQLIARLPDLTFTGYVPFTSIELRPRHVDLGTWVAEVPWDGDLTSIVGGLLTPGAGIVFTVNNEIVMSGPVTHPVRIREQNGAHTLQLAGNDDLWYLAARHARQSPDEAAPTPTSDGLGFFTDSHDVQTGVAETVIKHYVDVNAGPGAVAARETAGLVIAPDLVRGDIVTGRARMPNPLVPFIAELASAGGLGFNMVQTDQGEMTFDVFESDDKTAEIKFATTLHNVASYTFEIEAPTATHVTVGGGGEEELRYFLEDEVASDWGRIEGWRDQRQTTDGAELAQAAAEVLAEGMEKFSYSASLIPTSAHDWAPVAEGGAATYNLGDIVSIIVDGVEFPETIRELQVNVSTAGTIIVPIVGTRNEGDPQDRLFEDVARALRGIARRLETLEGQ